MCKCAVLHRRPPQLSPPCTRNSGVILILPRAIWLAISIAVTPSPPMAVFDSGSLWHRGAGEAFLDGQRRIARPLIPRPKIQAHVLDARILESHQCVRSARALEAIDDDRRIHRNTDRRILRSDPARSDSFLLARRHRCSTLVLDHLIEHLCQKIQALFDCRELGRCIGRWSLCRIARRGRRSRRRTLLHHPPLHHARAHRRRPAHSARAWLLLRRAHLTHALHHLTHACHVRLHESLALCSIFRLKDTGHLRLHFLHSRLHRRHRWRSGCRRGGLSCGGRAGLYRK